MAAITTADTLPFDGAALTTEKYVLVGTFKPADGFVAGANLINAVTPPLSSLVSMTHDQPVYVIFRKATTAAAGVYNVDVYYKRTELVVGTTDQYVTSLYGWQAIDVPSAELTAMFNFFIGPYNSTASGKNCLDASQYYPIWSATGLGADC